MFAAKQADKMEPSRDLEQEVSRLRKLVYEDELTGLGNRRAFDEQLRKYLALSNRHGDPLSLIAMDLDGFKSINDSQGHPVGDEVLKRVAAAASATFRESDHVARLGGDEFAIILPHTALMSAIDSAHRLRRTLVDLLLPAGQHVSASFGVAEAAPNEAAESLYARADQALYRAKCQGGGRVRFSLGDGED